MLCPFKLTPHTISPLSRYSDLSYWAPFVQIGKDVEIDLQTVRQAMLDQTIDRVEEEAARVLDPPPLNPEPVVPNGIVFPMLIFFFFFK